MILRLKQRSFSKSDLGLFLLTLYCLAAVAFLSAGTGAVWLRSWGAMTVRNFSISSSSMEPTLRTGEIVLGLMYTWQSPRLRRGDLIFHYRKKSREHVYISRVVGLPGDSVQLISGRLYINGKLVLREQIEDFPTFDIYGRKTLYIQYKESLPDGTSHFVTERDRDRGYFDDTDVIDVPDGEIFVMGDNRDNSTDSRDYTAGTVPLSHVLGRTGPILWSKDKNRIGSVPH